MKKYILSILILFFNLFSFAQETNPVTFDIQSKDITNTEKLLVIKAKALNGIKIISTAFINADLPINSAFHFDDKIKKYLKDSIEEIGTKILLTNSDIAQYKIVSYDSVTWQQKIQLEPNDSIRLKGDLEYYYQDAAGAINSGKEKISKQFFYTPELTNNSLSNLTSPTSNNNTIEPIKADKDLISKSLWGLFIAGLVAGLIGFVTPCVYALVPVTVSMFMKRSKTKAEGRKNVLAYAISILIIFTLVGILTGVIIPKTAIYKISTHWIFNILLFILFVIFGISFLGAFEIKLPNSWANKMDSKANTKSYSGIFFMALTLAIVSFSCTGPFVGTLLTTSFAQGKLGPAIGMFGFGLGLASPFALFAIFPNLITVLTKSGGWQNALKVSLGFIELALAFKFLSNADGIKGWHLLDREIFLIIWIVLFLMLGIYLLGKIRFKLDSDLPKNDWDLTYLPIPRLFFAIATFGFVFYMIPGLWGAPLKAISSFLPAAGTQDFNLHKSNNTSSNINNNISNKIAPTKYVSFLKRQEPSVAIENDFEIYYDYDEALSASKAAKKPLLLDFTGITCVNCRKFEGAIWTNKEVAQIMKNDFIIASLYTDYNEELNDNEKYYSDNLKEKINTVGEKNIDLQVKLVNSNTQPNYVFVNNDGTLLYPTGYGYEPSENAKSFIERLEIVKATFKKQNP